MKLKIRKSSKGAFIVFPSTIHYIIVEISPNCSSDHECLDISNWDGRPVHDDDMLFILPADKLQAFEDSCEPGIVPYVLLSDAATHRSDSHIPFISSNMPLGELWKIVRHSFHLLQRYDHIILTSLLNANPLEEILQRTANYWKASVHIFNNGGQHMLSVENKDSRKNIDVSSFEGVSFHNLFASLPPLGFDNSIVTLNQPFSKNIALLKKLNYPDMPYWMIMEGDKEIEIPIMYALRLLGNIVEEQFSKGNIHTPDIESDFSKSIGAILGLEITDPQEIANIIAPGSTSENLNCFQLLLIGSEKQYMERNQLKKIKKSFPKLSRNALCNIFR